MAITKEKKLVEKPHILICGDQPLPKLIKVNVMITLAKDTASLIGMLNAVVFNAVIIDNLDENFKKDEILQVAFKNNSGRVFVTGSDEDLISYSKNLGIIHIPREHIEDFINNFFSKVVFTKEIIGSYDLQAGNLLAVNIVRHGYDPVQVYVARIISNAPLSLEIKKSGYGIIVQKENRVDDILRLGDFRIMPRESTLIQGSQEDRKSLLESYLKIGKPIKCLFDCNIFESATL